MIYEFRIDMVARIVIDAENEEAARKIIDEATTDKLVEMALALDWEVELVSEDE